MNEEKEFNLEDLLHEDGETADHINALLPLLNQLTDTTPQPDSEALLATLLPELPTQPTWRHWRTTATESWVWLLGKAQLRVVRQEIWAASVIVMAIGVIISLIWHTGAVTSGLPFILTAPVVAAIGIAVLYSSSERVRELEMTTAVPPRLLLLVRLLLVFGFDLALGIIGSLVLSLFLADVALWSLITTWLAPMTFLAVLALLITVLSGAAEIGIIVSLGLWAMQIIYLGSKDNLFTMYWPDLLASNGRFWLWLTTFLVAGLAFWLGGREETVNSNR